MRGKPIDDREIDEFKEKLKDIEINFSDDLSNLEDTDFAEAAINLAKSEIVYKEALLLAYKMLRMNLEEFLK